MAESGFSHASLPFKEASGHMGVVVPVFGETEPFDEIVG
jgi:hypothetical protein